MVPLDSTFDPDWTSIVQIDNTILYPPTLETQPAHFKYEWPVPPTPKIKVEPALYKASSINETFDVNIVIENLAEEWKVFAIQFALVYNTSVLEYQDFTNGSFLEEFANNGETIKYVVTWDYHGVDP
ncbi:MAG: hypothetical protein DRP00_04675, partial [Candidatus Aenigmatarchaeota archaeon]